MGEFTSYQLEYMMMSYSFFDFSFLGGGVAEYLQLNKRNNGCAENDHEIMQKHLQEYEFTSVTSLRLGFRQNFHFEVVCPSLGKGNILFSPLRIYSMRRSVLGTV